MINSYEVKHYEVIVGNIGRVYSDNNWNNPNVKDESLEVYNEYVIMSKSKTDRASGESVWLLINGELVSETIGENHV